jgi:N-glycosylase/DNA lyase
LNKENVLIIDDKNILETFNLEDIFECGQCFRWNKVNDSNLEYEGIFKDNIINIKQEKDKIIIKGIFNKEEVEEYFDINRDYSKLKKELSKKDKYLADAIKYGSGIRILNQDLFEMIISFIISANNNIPRIKKIINNLSQKCGKEIKYNGKTFYSFPTIDELIKLDLKELRETGLGFRDKYIYNTVRKIKNNEVNLNREILDNLNTIDVKKELSKLDGVGPKVADCILLFSDLKRFDSFPIDVWVRRVMNDLYIKNPDEKKVKKEEIEALAEEKFGDYKGLAQQYLFYWKRETN